MDYFAQILANGLLLGAIYALMAVAYTVVYGVVRLVNFAFGELFMLGAILTATLMMPSGTLFGFEVTLPGLPFWLAALLSLAAVAAIGALIERLAFRPLRTAPRLAPLISSIAVSTLLMNLTQMIWGAQQIPMPATTLSSSEPFQLPGGVFITAADLSVIVTMVVAMLSFHLFVNRSRMGRAMRATAESRLASLIVGIPADRIVTFTFAAGSAFAALAGILYAQSYGSVYASMGFVPGLKALTAAVLGGIGSIPGAALGGLILGLVEALGGGYIPGGSAYKDAISFAILVLLLLFRPEGMLGRPEMNETARGSLLGQEIGGGGKGLLAGIADKTAQIARVLRLTEMRVFLGLFAVASTIGIFAPSNYALQIMTMILIYGMLASGLNLIVGFAGLLDLGFVAFWAVGSYVTSIVFVLVLKNSYDVAPGDVWWLLYPMFIVGGCIAALFGILIGYPTLKLRGDYLAIMTLGFGEIVRVVVTNWIDLTRGPMGIRGIPSPSLFEYSLGEPRSLFFFALAMAAVLVVLVGRLVRSKTGRAWVAIREDEDAAEASGINTAGYKLLAYACSAAVGGVVGVFCAHMQRYIGPANFSLSENITLLLLIVIGGLGTIAGPFIGAALWVLFLQLSLSIPLVQSHPEIRYVFLGAVLVFLMLHRPQGVASRARPSLVRLP
ncbi:ABC transporter permease [Ensifer adhaerens]|uniref:ABC transporter permease n=1 Tax=Ensifer adhaerens TaxID=106592 RepID=UPI000FD6BE34|nr:ABC transporter permease [Ensifer adhaerens]MDF8357555.1 ABC transporter permease [Ensifer adhaerens]THA61023.1 ABC transporter permease [Ensifer adhaerens]